MVGDSDGFYVSCRLASDKEPERRVWKLTTRTKSDRGELLYQAPFNFTTTSDDWTIFKVPFDSFKYVRGPRMIPDGPPLDTNKGLYQIGMTMSKFVFGANTTELEYTFETDILSCNYAKLVCTRKQRRMRWTP